MVDDNKLLVFEIDASINQVETCQNTWDEILKSGLLVANTELFA